MAGRPYISDNTLHLDGLGLDSPTIQAINQAIATLTAALASKQNTLVSGTNIKTINGESIIGKGDLFIGGGSGDGIGASMWRSHPEYAYCILDANDYLVWGIREDGSVVSMFDDDYNHISRDSDILTLNPRASVEYVLSKLNCRLFNENKTTHEIATFLWFSDLHGDYTNLQRIKKFYNEYSRYIDAPIATGDQITQKISDDWDWWNFEEAIFCLGNHEVWHDLTNKETNPATAKECYDKYYGNISKWGVTQPSGASTNGYCYFYKDFGAVRLISLDQMHWDSTQATWFTNTLSSAKSANKTVVVMGHFACGEHSKFHFDNSCGFTTIEAQGVGESPNASVTAGWVEQETILKSWIDGGGKFSVWLAGHTHNDYFGTSDKGIPCVVMEQSTWERCGADARVFGTKSQDSFNIITIDTYNRMFYIARIGNDVDKMMRSKKYLCYDYINNKVINNS